MASRKNGPDLTTNILVQIRDEMRSMHEEQRATNLGLDTTIDRLNRLETRQAEDTIRIATELVAVARAVGEVRDLLRDQRLELTRLEDHERRLVAIEKKIA